MLLYGREPRSDPVLAEDRMDLPVDAEAGAAIRDRLSTVLTDWDQGDAVDSAAICATEIATLLLDVGCGRVELAVLRHPADITVELRCKGGQRRVADVMGGDADRARSIGMVDRIAPLWGVRPTADGDAVWFELPGTAPPA